MSCVLSLSHTHGQESELFHLQPRIRAVSSLSHSQAPSKHLQTSVPDTGWIYGSGRDQHSSHDQPPRLHELPRWETAEKDAGVGMEWEGSWELGRLRTGPRVFWGQGCPEGVLMRLKWYLRPRGRGRWERPIWLGYFWDLPVNSSLVKNPPGHY